MRRVGTILALMVFCSALLPAESAKSYFKKGVQAEARQDYEAAYTYYRQAYQMQPSNLRYRVPYQRTRFMASASMVHRAQKLRDEGKLQEALQLFEQAAGIDPSNQLAGQEVIATQEMIEKQSGAGAAPGAPPKGEEDPLRKRLEDALPPVRLKQIANVPIDQLEMINSDTKTIYDTIGKIAGINVLFDPDFTPRNSVTIKLHNVNLQEALEIVALESRTFWRPVTPNTIFVAADTQAKRRELEQNAIKTFYLGNVSGPTDLQDIVNTIRTVLEVQRLQQIPSQNAIVMKATPDQLALAEKMIEDIDKGKPEVVVDVVVAQVRRDTTRNLGIIPPQNASVALQGSNVTTTPTGTTPGTTTTTNTGGLNFNNLQHLNSTNYAVTIAPVTAQALLNDTDTKILQSPQLRATNGEKAKLTIADKIPIATGSFGTPVGVGTAVGAVGVNTQFTYTDVGVILEITPTIHPDGQVTLKESLNISNLNGSSTIGGITQPIISQRAVENIVRLNDGEINMLGGIYENDYTKSISGWPFLGQIPILKYIFAQENKEVTTNEIVFLLMPHIVRAQMLTDMNRRSFDVGTGSGIDLHLASRGPEGGVVQPASMSVAPASAPGTALPPNALLAGVKQAPVPPAAPVTAMAGTSAPATAPVGTAASPAPATTPPPGPAAAIPSVAPAGTASPSAAAPSGAAPTAAAARSGASTAQAGAASPASNQLSLSFDPGNVSPAEGSTFSLNVVLAHGHDVASVPIQIVYDPKVLEFVGVTNGDYLTKDGQTVALVKRDDAASGRLLVSAQRPPGSTGISGDGVVFNLTFKAKSKGSGVVSIAVAGARNSQNQPVTGVGSQAAVQVN